MCFGVWTFVILFSIYGTKKTTNVYVVGGEIEDVSNTVETRISNTVDVNLQYINGYSNCFYNSYSRHPKDYYRIPIISY